MKDFSDRFLNDKPNLTDVLALFPHLQALDAAALGAGTAGVHPQQKLNAEAALVNACAKAAKAGDLDCASPAGAIIRQILTRFSNDPDPELRADSEEKFHEGIGWGTHIRSEAAEGLIRLASPT